MKICLVFPGQGSQHVGMGKNLYDNFGEVRRLYDEASEALGYDMAALSFNGPSEELNKTERTQPCLLTAGVAACTALALRNITPSVVAGHSLGEYTALVAAGSIAFGDAVRMTELRGRIMQDAVPEGTGLMAAVLGIDRKVIDEICRTSAAGYVSVANYNCPGQIVISGERPAVEDAVGRLKAAGAKRVMPLAVSVPSHCRLMEGAGREFAEAIKGITIKDPRIAFINNAGAEFISDAQGIRDSLIRQLSGSVLWEDSVKAAAAAGVDVFIEAGPGKVLSGLIKRIEPSARLFNVENMETLAKTVAELKK